MPPMVIRICFRCWPYTGRTMKRSNARPTAPADQPSRPASPGSTATRLRQSSREPVQSPMAPSTLVATKAPSAMNTPWPKLSTSIRPNTSVRPEAMMKMIMPMASPATVSVSQVEPEPMSGRPQRQHRHQRQRLPVEVGSAALALSAALDAMPRSSLILRSHGESQRQAQQRCCSLVFGQRRHGAAVHHAAVVHHGDGVAQALGEVDVLLDQQDGHAAAP